MDKKIANTITLVDDRDLSGSWGGLTLVMNGVHLLTHEEEHDMVEQLAGQLKKAFPDAVFRTFVPNDRQLTQSMAIHAGEDELAEWHRLVEAGDTDALAEWADESTHDDTVRCANHWIEGFLD